MGGGGGSGYISYGFQGGGGSLDLNFVRRGGGVIQNLDDGSKFQPAPPDTNNERSLRVLNRSIAVRKIVSVTHFFQEACHGS